MSVTELSKLIEEKATERSQYAREVWGAPRHIAIVIEPRLFALNKEIHVLQMEMYLANQDQLSHPIPSLSPSNLNGSPPTTRNLR